MIEFSEQILAKIRVDAAKNKLRQVGVQLRLAKRNQGACPSLLPNGYFVTVDRTSVPEVGDEV